MYIMSFKSVISNIASSASKYGKSIKANVNRMSYPKLKFLAALLASRLFLYFLVFVTIVVLFTYVNTRDITSVVAFLLIGVLASFFTKNMIVILSVALLFTWVLKYAMKLRHEGFEGKEEDESEEKKEKKEGMEGKDDEKEEKEDKKESMTSSDTAKGDDKEKEKDLKELKKDYESFEEIQKNILGGVKKINTELDKAETFINKYEQYKNKHVKKADK